MQPVSEPRFPVGVNFIPQGRKHPRLCTVTDILRTFDASGNLVRVRYVAVHDVLGASFPVTDYDVCETTISRGLAACYPEDECLAMLAGGL